MGGLRPVHLLILILVVLVLFGAKKMPDVARSLGRSMRIFKSEVEEMKNDGKTPPSAASSDTVKGETVRPSSDPVADPTFHPSAEKTPDPAPRETHNQPPA
jgi:sec-independent protein translocase protein TatA